MTIKPAPGAVHFPTTIERGPFPFPTSKPAGAPKTPADPLPAAQPSAEELRLMADTMPGDGPGD